MTKSIPTLIFYRLRNISYILRKHFYKTLGMKIGKGGRIGSINFEWPNKVSIGDNCIIEHHTDFFTKYPFSEENYIKIGNRTFIGRSCSFNSDSRIIIGDDCLIANNTTIVDVNHSTDLKSTMRSQPCVSSEINIKNDVWIGSGSTILLGVTIGEGSIIGAGSVVNKSIPSYQIWAGVPARFIKFRGA